MSRHAFTVLVESPEDVSDNRAEELLRLALAVDPNGVSESDLEEANALDIVVNPEGKNAKVVVVVRNGCCSSVYTSFPADLDVIDVDELEAEDRTEEEIQKWIAGKTAGLV